MAVLMTVIAGLFFLIGALLAFFGKNKKGLIDFSIGMAFSVMIMLLAFDIVPEITEALGKNSIKMYIFIIIGIVMLKLIDLLVPHHDHDAEIKHHERHLKHIGLISSLALIIHNIIEGIGIYNIALLDARAGLMMAIGVGLHNIPFGIEITATLNETKKNTKEVWLNLIILSISTLFGALIMLTVGTISEVTIGCLMSLTVGMIIYLVLFELLVELISTKNRKYSTIGIIIGVLFSVLNIIIGG